MKKPKIITSYRVKVLLIYLLFTMIPILIFMGVVHTQYVDRLRNQALDSLNQAADSMVNEWNDCLSQVKNISDGLLILDEITQNYFPDKPAEANKFRERLGVYVSTNTWFGEIALYSSDNDFMFSNVSSYTKERFLKQKHLDYLSTEDVDRIIQESYGPVLLDTSGDVAFCILYPMHTRNGTKALFFSIPTTKLNMNMSSALMGNEGYCQIMTGESEVLFSYCSNGVVPDPQVIAQSIAGQRSIQSDGQTWYCASGRTTNADMAVSVLISDGSVHRSVNSIKWSWTILILSSIGLCFAASWFTSFINAKPIVKLSNKISSSILEREESFNEMEHIDASVSHLSNFATTVQKQMAELGDYLTFRLLCGTIESVDEANQLSKMLGTSIYADTYQVCIVDTGESHSIKEVATTVSNLLLPEVSSLTRAFDQVFVCVLFCSLDDQNTIDVFSERFLQLYPNGKLSFGNSYSQLAEIPVSFMEAYLASGNEEGSATSFTYSETILQELSAFKQVTKTNNVQSILASLERLYADVEAKRYSLKDGKCLCVQFVNILSDNTIGSRLTDVLPNAYILISSASPEMLLKAMEPVLKEVRAMNNAHTEVPDNSSLVDQMVAYLAANYRNPNFSVQQMAFDFRLTPSALSRYFKEHYGRNINDYMNFLKMERAKQLLLETNLSIYEVGLELGYQGPNSFIRRFKATYGVTPGDFRQGKDDTAHP